MDQAAIEAALCEGLGVSKVLWVREGLLNDHTDGHIDTIARYVAPGVVACMKATEPATDPNHKVFEEIASDLASFTDAKGRRLTVIRVPSPGKILDEDGEIMPASYLNFYIGNKTVVVPIYGSKHDAEAVKCIAEIFPTRKTVGLPAIAILTGGGAFHCITQQQPAKREKGV
jgi:agmatine deiminase